MTRPDAEYFIELEVLSKEACTWADAGHVVASAQLPVKGRFTAERVRAEGKVSLDSTNNRLSLSGDGWRSTRPRGALRVCATEARRCSTRE